MDINDAMDKAVPRSKPPEKLSEIVKVMGGTRAVAERIGRSQRQVERYIKAERQGKSVSSPKVQEIKDLANSSEARRARLSPRREARIRNKGAKVKAKGTMGPVVGGKNYKRANREISGIQIPPEYMDAVMDAWLAGDDEGAQQALIDAMESDGGYGVDGWAFGDLDDFKFMR